MSNPPDLWYNMRDEEDRKQAASLHQAQGQEVPGQDAAQLPSAQPEDEQGPSLGEGFEPYFPTSDEAIELNQEAFGLYAEMFGDDPTWQGVLKPDGLESALAAAQMHYSYGEETDDWERLVVSLGKIAWKIAGNQVFGNANKRTSTWLLRHALDQNGLGWISPLDYDDYELADHLIAQDQYGQVPEGLAPNEQAEFLKQQRDELETNFLNMLLERYRSGGPNPNYQQLYPAGTYIANPEEAITSKTSSWSSWELGKIGKGFLLNDGEVVTWTCDKQGYPHHPDADVLVDDSKKIKAYLYFSPRGGFEALSPQYTDLSSEVLDEVQTQLGLKLGVAEDEDWDFWTAKTANILDPIHDALDPTVFDNPALPEPTLKPQHKEWITSTITQILEDGGYDGMEDWLTLVFTGSLTTYQYSEKSDVDISLFIDSKVFPEWSRAEMIGLLVTDMDTKFLPGTTHPLECYVVPKGIRMDQLYKPGLRSGYLLNADEWIVPPEKSRIKNVEQEMEDAYAFALQVGDKMDRLIQFEPHKAKMYYRQVKRNRRTAQGAGGGDYHPWNIAWKLLENRDLIPKD